MDSLYFVARYFPFWAIPTALILAEIARLAYRHGKKTRGIMAVTICVALLGLTVWYFVADGYNRLNPALYQGLEKAKS